MKLKRSPLVISSHLTANFIDLDTKFLRTKINVKKAVATARI